LDHYFTPLQEIIDMLRPAILAIAVMLLPVPSSADERSSGLDQACPETLDFRIRGLASDEIVDLCASYRGKVVLIVNTASKCGYTYQYEGLEELYRQYRDRGLVVLGFPSNDFGGQESGSEQKVQKFCRLTYSVQFPMFAKTRIRPPSSDPLYRKLGDLAGEYPAWNFHKYLLDRDGRLVGSFGSRVEPRSRQLVGSIESLL
jgi:glutathione peroxidase